MSRSQNWSDERLLRWLRVFIEKTPTELIAEDKWRRVKESWDHGVRLGEETLIDLLILDFMRFKPSHYKLFQINKKEESRIGADLEIRLHAGENQAAVFAVQAKKLYQSGRYERLNAKVKSSGSSQIDILEMYSESVGALPLYLLYNYVYQRDMQPYWHCCQCLDERQLGCTLVPSWTIRQAISNHGCRNFDWIHTSCNALPWRCLFDCPQLRDHQSLPTARRRLSMFREPSPLSDDLSIVKTVLPPSDDAQDYDGELFEPDDEQDYGWVHFEPMDGAWPDWLWEQHGATLSAEDFERLRHESRVAQKEQVLKSDGPIEKLVPRRLLLVKESD